MTMCLSAIDGPSIITTTAKYRGFTVRVFVNIQCIVCYNIVRIISVGFMEIYLEMKCTEGLMQQKVACL